jgi:DNA polymerase-3 subunit delta
MFGGRRAVHVRVGAKNIAGAVEPVLQLALRDCRIIIEAGDLKRNNPLRALCESARNAAAMPCYADDEEKLARLIDDEIRAAGLGIARDARAALVPLLGSDRRASLGEIRKLALYAKGKEQIEIEDIIAVVADASSLAVDAIVDAAFAGRNGELEAELGKARVAGTNAGTIVSTALRHVAQLHRARSVVESGGSLDQALYEMRPPVHFSRKTAVEAALRAWSAAKLERAMAQLAQASLETRRQASLAETIAHRALMTIASGARQNARAR